MGAKIKFLTKKELLSRLKTQDETSMKNQKNSNYQLKIDEIIKSWGTSIDRTKNGNKK
ncbi:MAG: hypothetical protein ACRC18_13300 [Cetobacterium sp.]